MQRDSGVVPIVEVDAIVETLRKHLPYVVQGTHSHALHCSRQPCLLGLSSLLNSTHKSR